MKKDSLMIQRLWYMFYYSFGHFYWVGNAIKVIEMNKGIKFNLCISLNLYMDSCRWAILGDIRIGKNIKNSEENRSPRIQW